MSSEKEKIPQNIQELIGEIGERLVLFKIYEISHSYPELEVFKNYSESGYDIGIRNGATNKKVKIEVKTRQRLITTSAKDNSCHFTLTENEKNNADFLVGYWLEYNTFFIVPIEELNMNMNDGKKVYKHIVSRLKNHKDNSGITFSEKSVRWINNWSLIKNFILNKKK